MSMFTLVVCSVLTVSEVFFILYSLNPHWLKVALGYSWVLDLTLGLGISLMMLSTGSVSGLIMSAITGAVLCLSLITLKGFIGYRKRVNGVWHEYPPTFNFKDMKEKVSNGFNKMLSSFKKKSQTA